MFLKHYNWKNLKYDIPAGIIVALVSIPISMGYAQVSGLPPVYGLYGSLLPILVYGLITSSPRFVFGVDAAPAALTGGALVTMGIAPDSPEAMRIVPVIALVTSGWLFLFWILKAGRLAKYISKPVLGGFVSGICCEIIIMQIPKLFGGNAATGELFTLIRSIIHQAEGGFSFLSLALGLGTIAVILISAKLCPKLPMSVVMMFVGALLTICFHVEDHGVNLLPAVSEGLPHLALPRLQILSGRFSSVASTSISIAAVIVAETLLSTNNYARRYGDKIDSSREILAYACGNLASALSGSCPVNGSVSRTGIADGLQVKSQMMSLVASLTMLVILLFATGFIGYLPVPVLTGIVIAALIRSTEFHIAKQLRKVDRTEFIIFWIVFFTVLILGTIYGVVIGVVLSFFTVVIRASRPQTAFLGCIPGKRGFWPLERMRGSRPFREAVIYQFTGQLFFANVDRFRQELTDAVRPGLKAVIVDAGGIPSIDITATEHLTEIDEMLRKQGIRFFLAGHDGTLNDLLRAYDAGALFRDGCLVPSVGHALAICGILPPYEPLLEAAPEEDKNDPDDLPLRSAARSGLVSEFEWLYGEGADEKMQEFSDAFARHLLEGGDFNRKELSRLEREVFGTAWSGADEEGLLDILEMQLASLIHARKLTPEQSGGILEQIARYRAALDWKIGGNDRQLFRRILERRMRREENFREKDPEQYQIYLREREEHRKKLEKEHPELAQWIRAARENAAAESPRKK